MVAKAPAMPDVPAAASAEPHPASESFLGRARAASSEAPRTALECVNDHFEKEMDRLERLLVSKIMPYDDYMKQVASLRASRASELAGHEGGAAARGGAAHGEDD